MPPRRRTPRQAQPAAASAHDQTGDTVRVITTSPFWLHDIKQPRGSTHRVSPELAKHLVTHGLALEVPD